MTTFIDYCEDILDRRIALMSAEERAEAYVSYQKWAGPQSKSERHPDGCMKLPELRAKVERLLSSQKIAAERNQNKDLSVVHTFIAQAETALIGKARKSDYLALITLNSEASRHLNSQLSK